jgi:hypothetical protein
LTHQATGAAFTTGRSRAREPDATALEARLEYARRRFAPKEFTLSVASFNRRAITV